MTAHFLSISKRIQNVSGSGETQSCHRTEFPTVTSICVNHVGLPRSWNTQETRWQRTHFRVDRLPQGCFTSFYPLLWSPAPRLNEMLWFHSMEKLLEVYSLRCMCVCVCDWSGGALSTPSRPPLTCHRWLFHLNYEYGRLHQALALNMQNGKRQLDLNVWGAENMKTNVI